MILHAPAAIGDVLDRITILRHKSTRVAGEAAANVARELHALSSAWNAAGLPPVDAVPEAAELAEVNRALWNVEDRLRTAESAGEFGPAFVADARSVYQINDRRAALKRAVNLRFGSGLIEEKVHPGYRSPHA